MNGGHLLTTSADFLLLGEKDFSQQLKDGGGFFFSVRPKIALRASFLSPLFFTVQ